MGPMCISRSTSTAASTPRRRRCIAAFGLAWGLGGWLLTPFLERVGPEAAERLRQRVADEVTTTFASHYAKEISLAEALDLENIAVYNKRATGEKYLVNPNKDVG